jgi:hypothetical protein
MINLIIILQIILSGMIMSDMKLPEKWEKEWRNPPISDRPLQIVHGIMQKRANLQGMKFYKDLGLGGIVCNVSFDKYMLSEENWKILIEGVESCSKLGMIVWLYDEDGYPSGAAGGLVLKKDTSFEAMELAFDESKEDPFIIRSAYEHTHATNNYYALRRYVNLIDRKAISCFIDLTHEQYWKRLKSYFGTTIQATFTDEPSLMAVNLGHIPEHVRKTVRIADPVNPDIKALPCIPWSSEIEKKYIQKFGESLTQNRSSLFGGSSEKDLKTRRQYWSLIEDLVTQNFFTQIQDWCKKHKVLSSGHTLCEETVIKQVPLYGNSIKALSAMDIPGLDLLSSEPSDVTKYGWLTAGLPCSAALLKGSRRIMTEVSDFEQKLANLGPTKLPEMKSTAAWQASWGVTDFTLYYGIEDRPEQEHKDYCDYVGRLNSILKQAQPVKKVLLYYPINDLWTEYHPIGDPLTIENQSERAQKIVSSFMKLGSLLQQSQIPFVIIDHEFLSKGKINSNGELKVEDGAYNAILIPQNVELPLDVSKVIDNFKNRGGKVLIDGSEKTINSSETLIEILRPEYSISPQNKYIALGRFIRNGKEILLIVNTSNESYSGYITSQLSSDWFLLDLDNGEITKSKKNESGQILIDLNPRQAKIIISIK